MPLHARLIPLAVFPLLFLLAGCEERPEPKQLENSFDLVTPKTDGSLIDVSGGQIKLKFAGRVSKKNSDLYVELNNADVTEKDTKDGGPDSDIYQASLVIIPLSSVRSSLVQGQNTLKVGQLQLDASGNKQFNDDGELVFLSSKVFHFNIDDEAPKITVDRVEPANDDDGDGFPDTGTTITVTGTLSDVSAIEGFSFTSPGGTRILQKTTNPVLADNQFNETTGFYRVVLTDYPDAGKVTSVPHFSYKIADVVGNSRVESFIAPGTPLSRQKAAQINNSLWSNINPVVNELIRQAYNRVRLYNVLEVGSPKFDDPLDAFGPDSDNDGSSLPQPVAGQLMKNPRFPQSTCIYPSPDVPGVEECRPRAYPGTRVFIYPANTTTCSKLLFDQKAGVTDCIVFIKDIRMSGPSFDLDFNDDSKLNLNLAVWFNRVGVEIEVVGARNNNDGIPGFGGWEGIPDTFTYLGGLKGTIDFERFYLETDLRISAGKGDSFVTIKRVNPFHLRLTDPLKVPVIKGSCNICSSLISPFSLMVLALGTDLNGNGDVDKKELLNMIGRAVEDKVGESFNKAVDTLTKLPAETCKKYDINGIASITDARCQPLAADIDKGIDSESRISGAWVVNKNSGHLVLNGRDYVVPALYMPSYLGGLGSLFAVEGKYYNNLLSSMKGWSTTSGQGKSTDFSFAISANSANQWLLSHHQSGLFDEMAPWILPGADYKAFFQTAGFITPETSIQDTDEVEVSFITNSAPSVRFNSETQPSLLVNKLTPATIEFSVNNLDVSLDRIRGAVASDLVDATIDMQMELEIAASAGLPRFVLKPESLRVHVLNLNGSTVLSDQVRVATLLADVMTTLLKSSFMTDQLSGPMSLLLDLLPGTERDIQQRLVHMKLSQIPSTNCLAPGSTGTLCLGGQEILYSQLLANVLPRDYAITFRRLSVPENGSYLVMAMDIKTTAPAQQAANFMTLRITAD